MMLKTPIVHLRGPDEYEPCYAPEERLLEEMLRREAERVTYQDNVMNRVVYDCVDPSPYNPVLSDIDHRPVLAV